MSGTTSSVFCWLCKMMEVTKKLIRYSFGFSQSGNFKEQGSPGVLESPAFSTETVGLARKTGAEEIKVRHSSGVNCVPCCVPGP